MDCLVLPVSMLSGGCSGSRLGYRTLEDKDVFGDCDDDPVTVVVGKEKKEFSVHPFVLEENPFRVLIELVRRKDKHGRNIVDHVLRRREKKKKKKKKKNNKRIVYVDVDAILFEHMLWLMNNDSSSLFQLNLKEIIDFYAHDF